MEDKEFTILVVDDEPDFRASVKRMMQRAKIRVIEAAGGAEALRIAGAGEEEIHLILLDLRMPKMNGFEVARELKKDSKTAGIPIIFFTFMASDENRIRAFELGAVGFISKTTEPKKFLETVKSHIKTSERWQKAQNIIEGIEESLIQESKAVPGDEAQFSKAVTYFGAQFRPDDSNRFKKSVISKFDLDDRGKGLIVNSQLTDIYKTAADLNVSEQEIADLISQHFSIPYLKNIKPERLLLDLLPQEFCRKNRILVIKGNIVVLSNPFDFETLWTLGKVLEPDRGVNLAIAEPQKITDIFNMIDEEKKKDIAEDAKIMSGDFVKTKAQPRSAGGGTFPKTAPPPPKDKPPVKQFAKRLSTIEIPAGDAQLQPIIFISKQILARAAQMGASDIHIEPKEAEVLVRFRIDGDLQNIFTLKNLTASQVISRYKVLAGMDIAEKRRPQDGGLRYNAEGKDLQLRLSTTSTPYGESIVIRLLEPDAKARSFDELGMLPDQDSLMRKYTEQSHGMLMIVGTTGSGKSTTVFSWLSLIDATKKSIITIEDPIEYRIKNANQQEISLKAGIDFENLMKTAMRQDPDVIFIGEVRDPYSARMAVEASSTGHLTITTLHCTDATSAVFRMERLGVHRSDLAEALKGILAQKLVKRLCPHCKEVGPPTEDELLKLRLVTRDVPDKVARPVGCEKCNFVGYKGREGIYELLHVDEEVSDRVRRGEPIDATRNYLRQSGKLVTVQDHALVKIRELKTSVEEAYAKALVEEAIGQSEETKTAPVPAPKPAAFIPDDATRKTALGISTLETGADDQSVIQDSPEGNLDSEIERKLRAQQRSALIVEDSLFARKLIMKYLESIGFGVVEAEDGVSALLRLGKESFDLIISDVNMPDLDGISLLKMIKQKEISTPVLLLTGEKNPELETKALELGAADFIHKPVVKNVLFMRIARALKI